MRNTAGGYDPSNEDWLASFHSPSEGISVMTAQELYDYRISLRERFDNLHPEQRAAVLADCFTELLLQDVDYVRMLLDTVTA